MLLGARQFFERRGGGWQNPYVTDGLVAMWDGEWNAGGGKHSLNATTWANIIDDSDIMTPVGTSFSWGDKSCSITNCLFKNTNKPYIATISSSRVLTMEVVLNRTGGSVSFSQMLSMAVGAWLKFEGAGYGMGNIFYPKSLDYVNGTTSLLSISVTMDTILGYKDAVLKSTVSNASRFSQYLESMSIGGDSQTTSFVGQIFCCRLYSRALTAAEIAANYAIDKARFNLP